MKTIRFGVIGIHGFSRNHINQLQTLMQQKAPASLVACVAHARELDEPYAAGLEAAGVKLVKDLDALLAMKDELDVITVPVGIHLHVPMSMKALAAGYHVYVEKPLVGAIQDGLLLAEAAAKARGRLFVGYNDMYQPATLALKRELASRTHGAVRRITVAAAWPRYFTYFARNNWAGKLSINGTWVLDCPANNACAHYVNLALYWAGATEGASAHPVSVTAELARANAIESADTTAFRVLTAEGVEVVFVASHACRNVKGPLFRIECEKALITSQRGAKGQFDWAVVRPGQEPEKRGQEFETVLSLGSTARVLNGEALPICTIEQALEQTRAIDGAFLSSPITTISDSVYVEETVEKGERLRYVPAMNAILDACLEKGLLPSETGLAPWIKPGKTVNVDTLREFKLG